MVDLWLMSARMCMQSFVALHCVLRHQYKLPHSVAAKRDMGACPPSSVVPYRLSTESKTRNPE